MDAAETRPGAIPPSLGAQAGPTIAVLAVQGAFIEHERRLERLGCTCVELRRKADLARPFDGLVLPGGESTAQAKLLRDLEMLEPLRERIAAGLPTLGTCAGLILLAERMTVGNRPNREGARGATGPTDAVLPREDGAETLPGAFATLPITVQRNAYGRQLGSFRAWAPFGEDAQGAAAAVPMTFIRAPRIVDVRDGARPLASVEGSAVAVRFGSQIGCAFHPELEASDVVFERFLELVDERGA